MNIEELIAKKNDLQEKSKSLCEDATKEVRAQLELVKEELETLQLKGQRAHDEEFKKMGPVIAEIFRLGFELYTLRGIDTNLSFSNHVGWINYEDGKSKYFTNYRFAKYEKGAFGELVPSRFDIDELYKEIKARHDKAFANEC